MCNCNDNPTEFKIIQGFTYLISLGIAVELPKIMRFDECTKEWNSFLKFLKEEFLNRPTSFSRADGVKILLNQWYQIFWFDYFRKDIVVNVTWSYSDSLSIEFDNESLEIFKEINNYRIPTLKDRLTLAKELIK
jgi:hypothetical protein